MNKMLNLLLKAAACVPYSEDLKANQNNIFVFTIPPKFYSKVILYAFRFTYWV